MLAGSDKEDPIAVDRCRRKPEPVTAAGAAALGILLNRWRLALLEWLLEIDARCLCRVREPIRDPVETGEVVEAADG